MKKLGGWTRLWIVAAVASFIGMTANTWINLPKAENIRHEASFYDQLSPELKANIAQNINLPEEGVTPKLADLEALRKIHDTYDVIEMPNGHLLAVSKTLSKDEETKISRAYWNVVERTKFYRCVYLVLENLTFWSIFIAVLYSVVWSVGWIYRGFREK